MTNTSPETVSCVAHQVPIKKMRFCSINCQRSDVFFDAEKSIPKFWQPVLLDSLVNVNKRYYNLLLTRDVVLNLRESRHYNTDYTGSIGPVEFFGKTILQMPISSCAIRKSSYKQLRLNAISNTFAELLQDVRCDVEVETILHMLLCENFCFYSDSTDDKFRIDTTVRVSLGSRFSRYFLQMKTLIH